MKLLFIAKKKNYKRPLSKAIIVQRLPDLSIQRCFWEKVELSSKKKLETTI